MYSIFINVCQCDGIVVYSRINYVPSPDGELLYGVIKIIKTIHTGFKKRVHMCIITNAPGADTEETGRYDLAWKDLCSVLNALSK